MLGFPNVFEVAVAIREVGKEPVVLCVLYLPQSNSQIKLLALAMQPSKFTKTFDSNSHYIFNGKEQGEEQSRKLRRREKTRHLERDGC